jgi:hypothetical protein
VEQQSGDGMPDSDEIAELRSRAGRGDRNAAGRLGQLLARAGDLEGALRVWADGCGDTSPTAKRLAELLTEKGDLTRAVEVWTFTDAVYNNPEGLQAEFLSTLDDLDRAEYYDTMGPEGWESLELEQLAGLLAERGDEASMAELRARAAAGEPAAAKYLDD